MRSIEVHILESESDAENGVLVGLLEPEDLTDSCLACSACSEDIGYVTDRFIAFAVVLDHEDDSWFVCLDCSENVTDKSPAYAVDDDEDYLDENDIEFDFDFDLDD
jgi:hypothetical protein